LKNGYFDSPAREEGRQGRDEGLVLARLDDRVRDLAAVAAQHAAEIREADAAHAAHRAVGDPGGPAPKPGVLALLPDGVHQVVALGQLGDDVRDLLGRVLQIRIQGHDPLAARIGEAGGDRSVLAEVAREVDQDHLRPTQLPGAYQLRGAVA